VFYYFLFTVIVNKLTLVFRPGFDVTYVGSVATGRYGDVKQIDNAMRIILLNSHGGSHHPSLFEVQEIGIKVTESATEKVCNSYKNKVAWRFPTQSLWHTEMHVGLHVKCPLLLFDCNPN
jgi:hypothetical protein